MPATPTECSVSRKAGFMLQILPCWSTVNIGKLMLSMFIVSPPCDGMHRVLAGCSESVRWDCSVVSLAAATHRGHGGLSASAWRKSVWMMRDGRDTFASHCKSQKGTLFHRVKRHEDYSREARGRSPALWGNKKGCVVSK